MLLSDNEKREKWKSNYMYNKTSNSEYRRLLQVHDLGR